MNPSNPGWLEEFVNYRKLIFESAAEQKKIRQGKTPDQSFYGLIQPTGIMYGCPVGTYNFDDEHHWTENDRTKILLLDSLINIAELYSEETVNTVEEFEQLVEQTLEVVVEYYRAVYPEISIATKTWLGKKKSPFRTAEQIINKRVNLMNNKNSFFWSSFFSRSQLFLDIYIFGQWTHTKPDNILLEFFKSEKEELTFTSVKVIAAAAHANSIIEDEERVLFEHFISNIELSAEKKRVANEYFEHGMGIQEIPIQESDPWIIRKFFLEMATLTICSDKKIEESERVFLEDFNESLGFTKDDFDVSLLSVEGFLLQNWSKLDNIHEKMDYKAVSEEYVERMIGMSHSHIKRIENKLLEDFQLLSLLKKGHANVLTEDDKLLIRNKFLKILQSIPNFRVVVLPDVFLSYENLLRVIPKEMITKAISQE